MDELELNVGNEDEVYHGFWISDKNQEIYLKAPDAGNFSAICGTNVLFHLLTAKEQTQPRAQQKRMIAERMKDAKLVQIAYNFAFEGIFKWMVKDRSLGLTIEQMKVGKRFLKKEGVGFKDDLDAAQKIVTKILLPPQIEYQGEKIWNPSRILLYNFILELINESKVDMDTTF